MLLQNTTGKNSSQLENIAVPALDNKLVATIAFAALFGSFLLYFVAFAHSEVLHNAGHDTRHAITVPCH
ncbi:MAG: cobalt transporter [Hyphomicrobiales bacterium]|nr:CbtB-domain containing protein [Hyphomicrobiales bacterium]PCH51722.1 MAG: cobalt transporter [Hyphomicrobiales bacterium]